MSFYTFAKLRPLSREEKIRGVQTDDLGAMIILGNSAYPGGWLADPSEGEILTGECTKAEAALIQEHGFFVSAPHSRHALGVAWGLGVWFWELPLSGACGIVHTASKEQISSAVVEYTKSQLALVLKEKSTEKLLSLLWFAWSNLSDRRCAEEGFAEILASLLDRLGRPQRAKILRRLHPPCRISSEIEFVRSPEWPLEIAE